jgi:hypothetical protein
MAGFGRFKLTDALPPEQQIRTEPTRFEEAGPLGQAGKGKSKGKAKSPGKAAKASTSALEAEQLREARESSQAKNAEASTRDRMVDIGRGNQQAGRQRAK